VANRTVTYGGAIRDPEGRVHKIRVVNGYRATVGVDEIDELLRMSGATTGVSFAQAFIGWASRNPEVGKWELVEVGQRFTDDYVVT
jgi:hypothetical protein